MLQIKIAGKKFRCPTDWREVNTDTAARMQKLVEALPDSIKNHYLSLVDTESIPAEIDEADKIAHTDFCRALLVSVTGVCPEVADRINHEDLTLIARHCFLIFILHFLGTPTYMPVSPRRFRQSFRRYTFPSAGKDISGNILPIYGADARQLCECTDLISSNDWVFAPLVVAILTNAGPYREERILRTSMRFKRLPAYLYLEAVHMVTSAHFYMEQEYKECYKKGKKGKSGSVPVWCDRLLFVADDRPSELPLVKTMPCYDFMSVLNGKIKRLKEQWNVK